MLFASIKRHAGSVSFRIASFFCLTFLAGLTFSFVATYLEISYSLRESSREVISTKLQEISTILQRDDVRGLRTAMANEKNYALNAPFLVRVLGRKGDVVYAKPAVQEKEFDLDHIFKVESMPMAGWQTIDAINDEDVFDLYTQPVGDDYYVQVGRSSEERQEVLERLSAGLVIAGFILIFFSGLLGSWYARRALLPVRQLIAATTVIEAGDLSRRVLVTDSRGELYDLAMTFNRMIGRIEKVVFIMRESIDHLAHEIRTPLARIKAVTEDALLKPSTDQIEALQDCAETVDELSSLVEQILSVSEAETGTMSLKLEAVEILALLNGVVELYEMVAEDRFQTITLISDIGSDLRWVMDRKKIQRAVSNLVDNALKFSPENSVVDIGAEVQGGVLLIFVRDRGGGISDEDGSRVWDRLFRSDRSRSTKGSGLGLTIVKALVSAHGGSISFRANADTGVTFEIVLPALEVPSML